MFIGAAIFSACVLNADAVTEAAAEVEALAVESNTFKEDYTLFMETPGADFFTISNLWLLIAAALVFIMHLGFATVESGLSQSKNTVNILFKNVFIISMGLITYALWGFNAMYPANWSIDGIFALGSWFDSAGATIELMTAKYNNYKWTSVSDPLTPDLHKFTVKSLSRNAKGHVTYHNFIQSEARNFTIKAQENKSVSPFTLTSAPNG